MVSRFFWFDACGADSACCGNGIYYSNCEKCLDMPVHQMAAPAIWSKKHKKEGNMTIASGGESCSDYCVRIL